MHPHSTYKNQTENRPGGPYRSRNGIIFGVCRGIADHFDVSAVGLRLIAVLALFLSGFWPVLLAYIIAAMIMKPEPALPFDSDFEAEFYNAYSSSRKLAIHRLKRSYDNLERRIQRMESVVTDKEFDWERRFHRDL